MKYQKSWIVLVLFCLAACSTNTAQPQTLATITATRFLGDQARSNVTALPVAERTFTPIPTPTPVPPTITPLIKPPDMDIQMICPENREKGLDELGLSPEARLIILHQDGSDRFEKGFYTLQTDSATPMPILNSVPTDGWIYDYLSTSPNGRWILFFRYKEASDLVALWIISLDGQTSRELDSYSKSEIRPFAQWMTDQTIIVYSQANKKTFIPYVLLDLSNGENKLLSPLPTGAKSLALFYKNSTLLDIYGMWPFDQNTGPYSLFNFDTQTSTPILQWLSREEWLNDEAITPGFFLNIWANQDSSINILIKKTYGFDIVMGADIDAIEGSNSYAEIMRPVHLPKGGPDMRILWHARSGSPFALERFDFTNPAVPYKLYFFDYKKNRLIDYCLEREPASGNIYMAPDEQFLAWNVQYSLESGLPSEVKEVVILSLQSGYLTRVKGVKFLGWGSISPEGLP